METSKLNWYQLTHEDEVDTPALIVNLSKAKSNIQKAIAKVGNAKRLRPHVKTNKSIEGCRLMMEAGIDKFKCATIAEAEMLLKAGAKDILLAYQPVGPKQKRWLELIKQHPNVIWACLVDHIQVAGELNSLGATNGVKLNTYMDINAGTNRTGISPGDGALELFEYCQTLPNLLLKGFHLYDGHLRDVDWEKRKKACDAAFQPLQETWELLTKKGYQLEMIAGGSTTFSIHAQRENVICAPGTFIYWDAGYQEILQELDFEPAAAVMCRVVSKPAEGIICVDLGHKSIAPENPIENRVYFQNASSLTPLSQSEEHLVLKVEDDTAYQIGQVLYGVPHHICPTVSMYDSVHVMVDGEITGEWKTIARDKKINF
ncbi:D-TA family PLP-dependent enzyme [Pleomorphovibrio marinus]|uniref:D-TA family PLP-dependent enzyme n=1 Tax=Pleomorphovibrio marinus TaxID=2164132 RepID=UPI000E0C695D|nr:D-TA family PLP-dependent enzyme [Pleomorphovibrio marinus]